MPGSPIVGMPAWWEQRRYGMFVHANLATVPAWSPIGQYADWYRSHLGDPVPDVILHPISMIEVLAHHRDRWADVERSTTSCRCCRSSASDPDAWAGLHVPVGMGYTVFVAKHHDGLCWWGTRRAPIARCCTTDRAATCSPNTRRPASDRGWCSAPTTRCSTGPTVATRSTGTSTRCCIPTCSIWSNGSGRSTCGVMAIGDMVLSTGAVRR